MTRANRASSFPKTEAASSMRRWGGGRSTVEMKRENIPKITVNTFIEIFIKNKLNTNLKVILWEHFKVCLPPYLVTQITFVKGDNHWSADNKLVCQSPCRPIVCILRCLRAPSKITHFTEGLEITASVFPTFEQQFKVVRRIVNASAIIVIWQVIV